MLMSVEPRAKRRQLSPEEKWQVFLEVTSQQLTQADAARKWRVDVSTVIKLRRDARGAALAAFAATRPGRPATVSEVVVDELRAENGRLTEAVKELAIELSLVRGKSRWG
jgi:transposase